MTSSTPQSIPFKDQWMYLNEFNKMYETDEIPKLTGEQYRSGRDKYVVKDPRNRTYESMKLISKQGKEYYVVSRKPINYFWTMKVRQNTKENENFTFYKHFDKDSHLPPFSSLGFQESLEKPTHSNKKKENLYDLHIGLERFLLPIESLGSQTRIIRRIPLHHNKCFIETNKGHQFEAYYIPTFNKSLSKLVQSEKGGYFIDTRTLCPKG